jgi:hypothetical protein
VQKWRIVTIGVSGGGSLTGPLRDVPRFTSTRGGTLYRMIRVRRWGLSIVQWPFSRAVPNLSVTIRNCCIAVGEGQGADGLHTGRAA